MDNKKTKLQVSIEACNHTELLLVYQTKYSAGKVTRMVAIPSFRSLPHSGLRRMRSAGFCRRAQQYAPLRTRQERCRPPIAALVPRWPCWTHHIESIFPFPTHRNRMRPPGIASQQRARRLGITNTPEKSRPLTSYPFLRHANKPIRSSVSNPHGEPEHDSDAPCRPATCSSSPHAAIERLVSSHFCHGQPQLSCS